MVKMKWNKYPDKKPESDMICYVCNIKAGSYQFVAIYHKNYDYFSWNEPGLYHQPPIEVTHWIELPPPPRE